VEVFGQYGFVLSVLVLLAVISDKGLNTYQSRQIAFIKDKTEIGRLIGSSIIARLFAIVIVVAIAFVIAYFIDKPNSVKQFMRFAAMAMGVNFIMGGFSATLLGYERSRLYGLLAMFTQLILTLLGFAALLLGYGLYGIGVAHLVSAVVATLFIAIVVNTRVCKLSFHIELSAPWVFIKTAFPLAVTAILMTIYYRADFVMLSFMKGDEAVGYYNSAYALINGMLMISTSFSAAVLPRLSSYFNTDKTSMNNVYQTGFKYLMYFGLAVALGTVFVAGPLYRIVYPESYLPGVISLKILIWALALMFINSIQSSYMIASNWKRSLMYITAVGAALNIRLNFIFIPRYSYQGAAIATLISEALTGAGFFWVIRHNLNIGKVLRWFIRLIPALAVMTAVLLLLTNYNVIAQIGLGAASFLVILIVFKGIGREEFNLVLRLISYQGKTK